MFKKQECKTRPPVLLLNGSFSILPPLPELAAGGGPRKTKVSLGRRPQVLEFWQLWGLLKAHSDQTHPGPASLFFELAWKRGELSVSLLVGCFSSRGAGWGVSDGSPPGPLSAQYRVCAGTRAAGTHCRAGGGGQLGGGQLGGGRRSWEALELTWFAVCWHAGCF